MVLPLRKAVARMTVVTFTILGEPVSKSRVRFTGYGSKTRAYTPAKTKAAETAVALNFRAAGGQFEPDPEVTFAVKATFYNGTRQRRDVDNMLKLILDGLNGVAWVDDTQVMEVMGRKRFTNKAEARTVVELEPIGRMDRLRKACEHCAEEFITYESLKGQRFCSRDCGNAARVSLRERVCAHCGKDFLAHGQTHETRFCSRECQVDSGWTDVDCSGCGVPFRRRRCHVRVTNYCTTKCRDASLVAKRKLNPKRGVCGDCGGPTSDKRKVRCQICHWAYIRAQKESA